MRSTSWAPPTRAIHPRPCWRCWIPSRTSPSGTTTWTFLSTSPTSSSSRPRTRWTPSPRRSWTAWRSSGSRGTSTAEKVAIAKRVSHPASRWKRRDWRREASSTTTAPCSQSRTAMRGRPGFATSRRPSTRSTARSPRRVLTGELKLPLSIKKEALAEYLGKPVFLDDEMAADHQAGHGHRPCLDAAGRRGAHHRGRCERRARKASSSRGSSAR